MLGLNCVRVGFRSIVAWSVPKACPENAGDNVQGILGSVQCFFDVNQLRLRSGQNWCWLLLCVLVSSFLVLQIMYSVQCLIYIVLGLLEGNAIAIVHREDIQDSIPV